MSQWQLSDRLGSDGRISKLKLDLLVADLRDITDKTFLVFRCKMFQSNGFGKKKTFISKHK